jgi:hypothetical protein
VLGLLEITAFLRKRSSQLRVKPRQRTTSRVVAGAITPIQTQAEGGCAAWVGRLAAAEGLKYNIIVERMEG